MQSPGIRRVELLNASELDRRSNTAIDPTTKRQAVAHLVGGTPMVQTAMRTFVAILHLGTTTRFDRFEQLHGHLDM